MKWTLEKLQKSVNTILQQNKNKLVYCMSYHEGGWVDGEFVVYADYEGNLFERHLSEIETDYPSSVYEEYQYIEDKGGDFQPSYWYSKKEINEQKSIPQRFHEAAIYILADSLAKKGYKHEAVLWALFNPEQVPKSWIVPYIGKPKPESDITYLDSLKEKMKLLHFQRWALKVLPDGILHETTFENHAGEHGYDEWDFNSMKQHGYVVECWSSYMFGGNCNCNNHEPGHSYEHDITTSDINNLEKRIIEKLEKNVPKL